MPVNEASLAPSRRAAASAGSLARSSAQSHRYDPSSACIRPHPS